MKESENATIDIAMAIEAHDGGPEDARLGVRRVSSARA
jgi:hypothetical protein